VFTAEDAEVRGGYYSANLCVLCGGIIEVILLSISGKGMA
jgi:hypothetical protein